jgi:hypothetical protein
MSRVGQGQWIRPAAAATGGAFRGYVLNRINEPSSFPGDGTETEINLNDVGALVVDTDGFTGSGNRLQIPTGMSGLYTLRANLTFGGLTPNTNVQYGPLRAHHTGDYPSPAVLDYEHAAYWGDNVTLRLVGDFEMSAGWEFWLTLEQYSGVTIALVSGNSFALEWRGAI